MDYLEAARSCLGRKDYAGYLANAQKHYQQTGLPEHRREVEKAEKAVKLHREITDFLKKDASDYYAVLGVPKTASQADIKSAYNTLIMRFHPDRTGMQESSAVSGMIQSAYTTLGNPDKRKRYDMSTSSRPFSTASQRSASVDDVIPNVFFTSFYSNSHQGSFVHDPHDLYQHLYSHMYSRFSRPPQRPDASPTEQKVAAFLIVIILIFLAM